MHLQHSPPLRDGSSLLPNPVRPKLTREAQKGKLRPREVCPSVRIYICNWNVTVVSSVQKYISALPDRIISYVGVVDSQRVCSTRKQTDHLY